MEIPCSMESVENVQINSRTGLIELTILINNEKVKNTRYLFKGMITKSMAHPDQSFKEKPNEIQEARRVMREAFERDPEFKQTYIANIACMLIDNIPGLKRNQKAIDIRDDVAEKILDRIFCE